MEGDLGAELTPKNMSVGLDSFPEEYFIRSVVGIDFSSKGTENVEVL
jgi:hypothetical protein